MLNLRASPPVFWRRLRVIKEHSSHAPLGQYSGENRPHRDKTARALRATRSGRLQVHRRAISFAAPVWRAALLSIPLRYPRWAARLGPRWSPAQEQGAREVKAAQAALPARSIRAADA